MEKDEHLYNLKLLAESGDSDIAFYLGNLYYKGIGIVKQDLLLALQYFNMGANNGHEKSKEMFNELKKVLYRTQEKSLGNPPKQNFRVNPPTSAAIETVKMRCPDSHPKNCLDKIWPDYWDKEIYSVEACIPRGYDCRNSSKRYLEDVIDKNKYPQNCKIKEYNSIGDNCSIAYTKDHQIERINKYMDKFKKYQLRDKYYDSDIEVLNKKLENLNGGKKSKRFYKKKTISKKL
jgi:TPR repeat protein